MQELFDSCNLLAKFQNIKLFHKMANIVGSIVTRWQYVAIMCDLRRILLALYTIFMTVLHCDVKSLLLHVPVT